MHYCISDLHGRYDLFRAMLKKINFNDKDTLFVLGDFVDRGSEGLHAILDVAKRDNVICIMGNHDCTALSILLNLRMGIRPENLEKMKEIIDVWVGDGGRETYAEYQSLTSEEQKRVLAAMDAFRNYAVAAVGDRKFVLCHGGIKNYTPAKPLSDYTVEDFAFTRADYTKPIFSEEGKFLVTGHTPTICIEGGEKGKILKAFDHIAIDCGAVFGFGLGCLRLEDLEEFYVNDEDLK